VAIHGKFDHEIKIGTTTTKLELARDQNNRKIYHVEEEEPDYRNPLRFTQTNWVGGHGQHTMRIPDMYFEGQSIDTTQDGRVILGPEITEVKDDAPGYLDSAPVAFMWAPFSSARLLMATSGKIYLYDSTNNDWETAATTVAGVQHEGLAFFNGEAYAALGASNTYYHSTDGSTWAVTDLTDDKANGFMVAPNAEGTSNRLWKWKQPNEITSTTDGGPSGTAYDSAAYVGDTSNNINKVFLISDNLMIGREDGLFHYDSDGGVHTVLDLRHTKSTQNFKYVCKWASATYVSLSTGLGEIASYGTFARCGPLEDIDDIGKHGTIVGLAASDDDEFFYVAYDEGTNTIIYKCREIRREGGLRWEYCPFVFLGTRVMTTMAVIQHSATDKRLWFGYTDSTNYSTAYVKLSDNPTDDSDYRFTTAGWVRMSFDYGTDPNWDKLWQSAVLEVTGGDTGETVQVKYKKDTSAAAECIAAAATNGIYETNFTSAIACNRIQFELHLASNTNTATPEVHYFQAKGIEKPTTVRTHDATYRLGTKPTAHAKTLRTFLRGGRTSTTLIKFADLRYGEKTSGTSSGDYVWCVMEPGFPQEVEIEHTKGQQPELGLRCRFREVSFTIS